MKGEEGTEVVGLIMAAVAEGSTRRAETEGVELIDPSKVQKRAVSSPDAAAFRVPRANRTRLRGCTFPRLQSLERPWRFPFCHFRCTIFWGAFQGQPPEAPRDTYLERWPLPRSSRQLNPFPKQHPLPLPDSYTPLPTPNLAFK